MNLYIHNRPLRLESGLELANLELAYHTWGKLNSARDNVIWVCHALTGDSDAASWWPGLIGPGLALDTDRYFVICANVLGGCYGSTGPLSTDPTTEETWYTAFPEISIRDIVSAFSELRKHLGITSIHTLIGGSMGGQQGLEWAIREPELIQNLIPVATNAKHSPWGIAFNETQRAAIETDPTWGAPHEDAGKEGLKVARQVAMLSYRGYGIYEEGQSSESDPFLARSYQRYQGEKLADRFNAYSYCILSKAMDSQDVGRNRGGILSALSRIKARTLVIGVDSDLLFPTSEQHFLAQHIERAEYHEVRSIYGHDGFLVETRQIAEAIKNFHKNQYKTYALRGVGKQLEYA